MRTVFLFLSIFVIASAYRGHQRRWDRGGLHLHRLRGDVLRDHYQRHHFYKDTDEDSDEYLYNSNDNSDSNSYENSDDDSAEYLYDSNENSDSDSYENSEDDSDNDSDEAAYDNSAEDLEPFVYYKKRLPEPHFVSCFGPRKPNGYGRHMKSDSDDDSDNAAFDDSAEGVDPFKNQRQPEPHFVSGFGPRKPYKYWRHTNSDSDANSDYDSNENSYEVVGARQRPGKHLLDYLRPAPHKRYMNERRH